jgi:hypothetical protein
MPRIALALLLLSLASARAESEYTQRMFRRAMVKDNLAVSGVMGLSPLYVLITLRDRGGHDRIICTGSNFLYGAIHTQYRLPYDAAGERRAFDIAMSAPQRVFTFTNRRAVANVTPNYTPQQVARVHERLAQKNRARLRAEVDPEESDVTHIYRRIYPHHRGLWQSDALRDAVAHVLLERGVLVGWAHGSGGLYLDK